MPPTNTEQHLLNAAERIEGTVSTIKDVMGTFSERYQALLAENQSLRDTHPNPPDTAPPENLDDEFAQLDSALSDMEKAGSSMRAAASSFANSGQTDAQVGLGGQQGQGTTPAPASPVPSGQQETGPTGRSLPPSQASDEVAASGSDAATTDTQFAQGGPQESPGVTSTSDGVLIGDDVQPPAPIEEGGEP